jgi:hypothetical protein
MIRAAKVLIAAFLITTLLIACSDTNDPNAPAANPALAYDLPGDIADTEQTDVDQYSWKTFLALNAPAVGARVSLYGDNPTQYSAWSSSFELIRCNLDDTDCVCPDGDCANSGTRYYPPECQAVENHTQYRVLDNANKADDSFLEAETGGLSNSPVLTSQGDFVRYEILVNPAFYKHVVANRYYDWEHLYTLNEDVANLCGDESYTGGDPANPQSGTYEVKLAWMEQGLPDTSYHREDLLVYTPSYRSSTATASCELKSMAMVGMHIAHKTLKQPNYTWSTFEHKDNSPECSGLPPAGTQGSGPTVNSNCPSASTLTRNYHFTSPECADGSCAECNATPDTNDPQSLCVTDPTQKQVGWCLDQPPAAVAGKSQLCRQVPVEANYPSAFQWNNTYAELLGEYSVWSNYQLVSTQWYKFPSPPVGCANAAPEFANSKTSRPLQRPQVAVTSPEGETRPLLGNNSMESYERSNCNACHGKSTIKQQDGTTRNMDFVYWIPVESCAVWCDLNAVNPCSCYDAISQ